MGAQARPCTGTVSIYHWSSSVLKLIGFLRQVAPKATLPFCHVSFLSGSWRVTLIDDNFEVICSCLKETIFAHLKPWFTKTHQHGLNFRHVLKSHLLWWTTSIYLNAVLNQAFGVHLIDVLTIARQLHFYWSILIWHPSPIGPETLHLIPVPLFLSFEMKIDIHSLWIRSVSRSPSLSQSRFQKTMWMEKICSPCFCVKILGLAPETREKRN